MLENESRAKQIDVKHLLYEKKSFLAMDGSFKLVVYKMINWKVGVFKRPELTVYIYYI